MFNVRRKAMKYRIMVCFTIMASLLFFGVTGVISARKASAHSVQPKEKKISQESMYTIQTGSFKNSQRAEKQFRIIKKSLEGTALQALRIEKIGRFYAVRAGRFASLAEAEQFLRKHKLSFEGSMVMKAYFINERIHLIHDGEEEYVLVSRTRKQRDRYLPDLPYARNDLGLKLVGTALVDEPENNIALIENLASGDQEIYKKGDMLKGVLIKRILSRRVIIDEGRGDEILMINDGEEEYVLVSRTRKQRDRYLTDLSYARNDLGLKLVGTALVDEPENNIALIENLASGDQDIYKKGDMLKGVLIKRILSRRVIIDKGRGDEILIMVRGTNTGTLQSESQRVQPGK